MDSSPTSQLVDLDARKTCPGCRKSMGSMTHGTHNLFVACGGIDSNFDNRCGLC